jgi:hypothetical protein
MRNPQMSFRCLSPGTNTPHTINVRPRPACAARKQPGPSHLEFMRKRVIFPGGRQVLSLAGKIPARRAVMPKACTSTSARRPGTQVEGDIVSHARGADLNTNTINTLRSRSQDSTGQPWTKSEDDSGGVDGRCHIRRCHPGLIAGTHRAANPRRQLASRLSRASLADKDANWRSACRRSGWWAWG